MAMRGRVAAMHKLRSSMFALDRDLAAALSIDFPSGITGERVTPSVIVLRDKERKYKHKCVKKLLGVSCKCLK